MDESPQSERAIRPRLRWFIVFALFLAAVLNYIDRNVMGLLAPTIQKDLAITDSQYAVVIDFFLVAYGVAYLLSGRVVDALGVRVAMAIFIGWWSISNALTGLARSAASLTLFRFLLGLGEAGLYTASPKAVSQWFPPAERGVAVGIYGLGGALGATIAPLLITWIAVPYGWRWVFALSPILAAAWLVMWFSLYRPTKRAGAVDRPVTSERISWPQWAALFCEPYVWRLTLARLLTDPVWYFIQFWMPKYLFSERHLTQGALSGMWKIFLASDLGFLVGGLLSGWLIRRGSTAPAARLRIMLASSCLAPLCFLIPSAPGVTLVFVIGMIVAYAHTQWLSNLTALAVDIAPPAVLGSAFGIISCGSVFGGIVMNGATAWLVSKGSYATCFYVMAGVYPLAMAIVWRLRKTTAVA